MISVTSKSETWRTTTKGKLKQKHLKMDVIVDNMIDNVLFGKRTVQSYDLHIRVGAEKNPSPKPVRVFERGQFDKWSKG